MHGRLMRWTMGIAAVAMAIPAVASAQSAPTQQQLAIENPPTPTKRGQSGFTFLQIGGSARAEGMGGAFSGMTGDPSAVFYNPAAMATVKGYAVYFDRANWLADMTLNHFVASGSWHQFTGGLTFVNMDYGTIVHTIITNGSPGYAILGNVNVQAWAAGVFAAMQMTDRFRAGFQIKYARQDMGADSLWSWLIGASTNGQGYRKWINPADQSQGTELIGYDPNRVGTLAYDIGTQYETGLRNITLNMSLTNFASAKQYVSDTFDLPLTYRVGIETELWQLITGEPNAVNKFLLAVDGLDRRDVPLDVAAGLEYTANLQSVLPGTKVSLRVGRRAASDQDGWLAYGGSAQFAFEGYSLRVDYSHDDYGPALTASRLGVAIMMK